MIKKQSRSDQNNLSTLRGKYGLKLEKYRRFDKIFRLIFLTNNWLNG